MGFIVRVINSYFVILVAALVLGMAFSGQVVVLEPFSTVFLGIIFFLSALKIDLKEVISYLGAKKMIFVVNLFMLIAFPVVVYYLTLSVVPALAIAFMILAAMPSGMTDPLLSEISGGRQSLALVLTISTSLLAPLTVPLVIKLLAGQAVAVSFSTMFLSLAKIIFIPFVIANIIKFFWNESIKKISSGFRPVSIIFLGLLIMGIVAKQADVIIEGLKGGQSLTYLAYLFILFIIFHIIGYFSVFWREKRDRITVTVCLSYMNFTLAIYLVDKFFSDPNIIVPVILSVVPWSVLFPLFKYGTRKNNLI